MSRRAPVAALALLHALLLLGAPLADAIGGVGESGPHFEERRSDCRALDSHFCCAFCRVIGSSGQRSVAPGIPFLRAVHAIAPVDRGLAVSRAATILPLGARAPPRLTLAVA